MIMNEAAYEAGVRRAILRNARKYAPQKFEETKIKHPEVVAFLTGTGEFEGNRFSNNSFGQMLSDFADRLMDFGNLSEKQIAVVEKAIVRHREWKEARAAEIAEKAETTEFVGTVGQRQMFTVLVVKSICVDSYYGAMNINICEDENGNVIVYRGNAWNVGEKMTFSATIKKHDVYQGIKQTIVNRPTKIEIH